MRAIIDKNNIIINNVERISEEDIFEDIVSAFNESNEVNIKDKIMGPGEDVVIAECNNEKVILTHDIDYGISPIECTKNNIDIIFNIITRI